MMKPTIQNLSQLALSLVLIAGLTSCSDAVEDTSTAPAITKTVLAEVQNVQSQALPVIYATSGIVTSDHRVAVSSRLSGYIRDIRVKEGSRVKKGDELFRVDPVDARQQLAQAKADLENAKVELNRFESLLADKAVSQQQFDQVKLRYEVAKSKVTQAENQLRYAVVRAPVNGIIVEKRLNVGDLASPGTPILTLEDPLHLLVETYVSEKHIASIQEGDAVTLNIAAIKQQLQGEVRQVVQVADARSHKFLVKASIPPHKNVRPGIFVEVAFSVGQRQSVMLPVSAIVSRNDLSGVYIVDENNIAHYRLLRLGQVRGSQVEVAAGLTAGQRIVNHPPKGLLTGMKVQAKVGGDE